MSDKVTNKNKIMNIDRGTFIISVVSSIVASVLFGIFIQPIISFSSSIISHIISAFYQNFTDSPYLSATGSITDVMIFYIFMIFVSTGVGMSLAVLSVFYKSKFVTSSDNELMQNSMRGANRIRYTALLIAFFMIPWSFIVSSSLFTSMQAKSTFDRRIMALSSVITEQERKNLMRDWALMKTKADFDLINRHMEEFSSKYNSKIPDEFPRIF